MTQFPTSLDPDETLEMFIGELKLPVQAIAGWAQVVAADDNLEAGSLEAAEAIPFVLAQIAGLLTEAEAYLVAWRAAQNQPPLSPGYRRPRR